jgi:hypothetical protein
VEGRDLSSRQTQNVAKDMEIGQTELDDVPSPWWSERILAPARLGWRRRLNNPFRDFDTSPDVIRMFVMTHVRFPLSLRKLKMSSPRSSRLVDRFGTTRPFAVSTTRVDVKRT